MVERGFELVGLASISVTQMPSTPDGSLTRLSQRVGVGGSGGIIAYIHLIYARAERCLAESGGETTQLSPPQQEMT